MEGRERGEKMKKMIGIMMIMIVMMGCNNGGELAAEKRLGENRKKC